jgi:hypothetical protein
MKDTDFLQLLHQITKMDHRQRSSLLNALTHLSDNSQVIECIESHFDADCKCPFCSFAHYYRQGSANGLQRYRCIRVLSTSKMSMPITADLKDSCTDSTVLLRNIYNIILAGGVHLSSTQVYYQSLC